MYGETAATRIATPLRRGLSPRVRGNLGRAERPASRVGSIPACTGKPTRPDGSRQLRGVYPRVYGETIEAAGTRALMTGLSPRVRGNRGGGRPNVGVHWSIPACTGKPTANRCGPALRWVYPRVYGETQYGVPQVDRPRGLSPRVRGNLQRGAGASRKERSIPACTGKPALGNRYSISVGVYPRVYGETSRGLRRAPPKRGLSPRVRGNRQNARALAARRGSIPACTGKPEKAKE